jgi:hypothetical protein
MNHGTTSEPISVSEGGNERHQNPYSFSTPPFQHRQVYWMMSGLSDLKVQFRILDAPQTFAEFCFVVSE